MPPDNELSVYESPLSCNLGVFSTEENKRHETLLIKTLAAIREVENGYMFSFSSESLLTIADWVSLERRCCSFLSFQVGPFGSEELFWLTLSGPNSTKNILRAFFHQVRTS